MRRILLVLLALVLLSGIALAHGGRTDSNGGHWDHSTGEYHLHNDGSYQGGSSSGNSSSIGSSSEPYKLVTTGSVNMRNGAGTSYSVIRTLPEGTTVIYGGKASGNWLYIKYGTQNGWIHRNYARVISWKSVSSSNSGSSGNNGQDSKYSRELFTSSGDTEPALIRTNASTVMRSGAGDSYDAITRLSSGLCLTYGGKTKGSWAYVSYGFTYGWVKTGYLDILTTRASERASDTKGDEPSVKMLILVFCIGLIIGFVPVVVLAKRKIKDIKASANNDINRIKGDTQHEISQIREYYKSYLKERQELQAELLNAKKVIDALKTVAKPDLSEGVVYISSSLEHYGKYHHSAACSDLDFGILVSKKAAIALGCMPCACTDKPEPQADTTVYITENNYLDFFAEAAYHNKNCRHVASSKVSTKLSYLTNRYHPCSACKPPKKNPTVWL